MYQYVPSIINIFVMMDRCDINSTCVYVDTFFYLLLGNVKKLIMIYLKVDRLLDINLHLRYSLYFSEQRVKNIILTVWLFCSIYALMIIMLNRFDIAYRQVLTLFVVLFTITTDTIILTTALTSYLH